MIIDFINLVLHLFHKWRQCSFCCRFHLSNNKVIICFFLLFRFAKLATKMYKMITVFSFFSCNQWNFDDQNTEALYNNLSKEDQQIFNFDMKNIDYREYLTSVGIGIRKYIVKDGLTGTLYARRKMKVLKVLTIILLPLYFYCLFRMLCFVLSSFTLFW